MAGKLTEAQVREIVQRVIPGDKCARNSATVRVIECRFWECQRHNRCKDRLASTPAQEDKADG